tara:strand:+ start:9337 stop:9762 length:426 start_codon:yes stop_codon:yes gene_type:complete
MENTKLFRIDEQNHHLQQTQKLNDEKKNNINNTNLEVIKNNFFSEIDETINSCNKNFSLINEKNSIPNSNSKLKKNVVFNQNNNVIFENNNNFNILNFIINILYLIIVISLMIKTVYSKDSSNFIYVLLYTFIFILIKNLI